jgi:hypothetical protein
MSDSNAVPTGRLILVPAVITLAVTLLRLAGELLHWSPVFFSRAAGGGGAIVGISWLPLFFGPWFAWRLAKAGDGPGPIGRAIGLVILALAITPVAGFVAVELGMNPQSLTIFIVYVVAAVVAIPVAMKAWPALGRVLLAYAFAARIPVAIVMLFAILGSWGTHYDVPPPGFPEMGALAKWAWIGLLPQMTIWIAFTVVVGALFGIVAVALVSRRLRPAKA